METLGQWVSGSIRIGPTTTWGGARFCVDGGALGIDLETGGGSPMWVDLAEVASVVELEPRRDDHWMTVEVRAERFDSLTAIVPEFLVNALLDALTASVGQG